MMNPVPWLQMTNMISYQGLVRTFPKGSFIKEFSHDNIKKYIESQQANYNNSLFLSK